MKNLLLTLLAVLAFSCLSFAQTSEEEIITALYGVEKRAIVEDFMALSPQEAEVFWMIYSEYEQERMLLTQRFYPLLKEYTRRHNNMNDEYADRFMKEVFKLDAKQQKITRRYYKKVRKMLSPTRAVQFTEMESYLRTALRLELMSVIPFVEKRN